MTREDFKKLPSVVRLAIEMSGIPIDRIEVVEGTIKFPLPDGMNADDKNKNEGVSDCLHCPVAPICPDADLPKDAVRSDAEKAIRDLLSHLFDTDDEEDEADGKEPMDFNALAAWNPGLATRVNTLIELGVNKVATLSDATGIDPASCERILHDKGFNADGTKLKKRRFIVPVAANIAVTAHSEQEAIDIARGHLDELELDETNVPNETSDVYAATLMFEGGHFPDETLDLIVKNED